MTGDPQGRNSCNLRSLQVKLEYDFADLDLLDVALTHSSVSFCLDTGRSSNERLEFLGDRVLGLAIADMLYNAFSHEDEGAMARRHAALVRRETLARVAQNLNLGDHIRMSRSEVDAGGRRNLGLLSNACEAVIAAIYLDSGLEAAADFVYRNWRPLMERQTAPPIDAKTKLQEWAQSRGVTLPEYREINRHGPAHAPTFLVEVSVVGVPPARATGQSKRGAEQAAAAALLTQVRLEYGG